MRAGRLRELRGEAEADGPLLAVEHDDARGGLDRDWIACSAAVRSPARPSVTMIASARRDGSRRCSVRMTSSVCSSPCASGVLPPVGRALSASAARSTLLVGASGRPPVAAERDERDLVPPLVGVGEQAEHGGLDLRHAAARAHRPRRVHAEHDQVALAPGADVLSRHDTRPAMDRGGAQRAARARSVTVPSAGFASTGSPVVVRERATGGAPALRRRA